MRTSSEHVASIIFEVPPEVKAEAQQYARATERSLSAVVRMALRTFLDQTHSNEYRVGGSP